MHVSKGAGSVIIVGILAVLLIAGGLFYYFSANRMPNATTYEDIIKDKEDAIMNKDNALMKDEDAMEGDTMMKDNTAIDDGDTSMEGDVMMPDAYQGTVLAGTKSPLLNFNKTDYDRAVASDKLVVLYFYANWCPICKAEFPKMQEAFNKTTQDNVIGFRVNFNDSDTDDDEVALARQFGVAYQHTKVFVKNGERVLKSPEGWGTATYLSEIDKAANE